MGTDKIFVEMQIVQGSPSVSYLMSLGFPSWPMSRFKNQSRRKINGGKEKRLFVLEYKWKNKEWMHIISRLTIPKRTIAPATSDKDKS